MQEHESVRFEHPWSPHWSTSTLAVVGNSLFVSGLFVLVAAGRDYPALTYVFILASAALISLPLVALTGLVAGSESFLGRAWANGLRPLAEGDRRPAATAMRALRYASVLWLANGAAMWLATFLAQFAA